MIKEWEHGHQRVFIITRAHLVWEDKVQALRDVVCPGAQVKEEMNSYIRCFPSLVVT